MTDAANVTPIREFNDVVRIVNRKLEAIEQSEKKTQSLQIEAGKLLLELRGRVDAGEIGEQATWWEWFEDNFRRISRRTAERYMQIARDEDPETKLNEMREADAERKRAGYPARNNQVESKPHLSIVPKEPQSTALQQAETRRVSAAPSVKYPSSPDDDGLIAVVMEAWRKMSWDGRVRLFDEIKEQFKRWRQGED